MVPEGPTSRKELAEARDRVQRQIEILESASRARAPFTRELLGKLRTVLNEIDTELAGMRPTGELRTPEPET